MMPITVTATDKLGRVHLRTASGPTDNTARYFSGVGVFQGWLRSREIQRLVTGFYLSMWDDGGIRFSYFTADPHVTEPGLTDRILSLGFEKYLPDQDEPPREETFESYLRGGQTNLAFRRFLQLMTNVGLELLDRDEEYSRRLVKKYRLDIAPSGGSSQDYFRKAFDRLAYFRSLPRELQKELLEGLDHDDWAHMFVVMLRPGDWKIVPRKIVPGRPLVPQVRRYFALRESLPEDWEP